MCSSAPVSSTPPGFRPSRGSRGASPPPGHKATGEERAWGRRLAKRFGCEGRIDDRTFILSGDGNCSPGLDFESAKANGISADVVDFFKPIKKGRGDSLVAFGWAMAE